MLPQYLRYCNVSQGRLELMARAQASFECPPRELRICRFSFRAQIEFPPPVNIAGFKIITYNDDGDNTLPLEVRQSHSLSTFRNRLKIFCFRSAYPSS